jgi:type VI secretion system FHA domain protein
VGDPGFQQLGPDEMRLLGQLLREATQGTVELLLSRAALKREMRAEVTVIAARQNNPLKFSPTVEVALQYLLGSPKPGFMPPAPAMRDAFNDLRAHQLGMMAGMRSALEGVLKRFDPAVLESRIEKRSGLSAVLPGSRKARLWELFQELYGQLSAEAEDDFHQLFGKAFLAAYESYIEQLQSNA